MAKTDSTPPDEDDEPMPLPVTVPNPASSSPPPMPKLTEQELYQLQQALLGLSWQIYWLRTIFERWLWFARVSLIAFAAMGAMGLGWSAVYWMVAVR